MHDSLLMNTDELLDSYDNDGYVYCIMTGLNIRSYTVLELNFVPLVKIGKIGMKKNLETVQRMLLKMVMSIVVSLVKKCFSWKSRRIQQREV